MLEIMPAQLAQAYCLPVCLPACLPSDKCNSIMAKAAGLILSLFDVVSAQRVPFGTYNARIRDLPLSSFVSHFYLLTAQDIDLQ